MALCTVDQVKAQYEADPGSGVDAQIEAAIALVSGWFPIVLDCYDPETGDSLLERFTDRVEQHEGGETLISLRGFPIISLGEVVEATRPADLDAATALTEDEDFYRARHFLHRLYAGTGTSRAWERFVRVTYIGGYDPAGTEVPTLALPDWLVQAAAQQAGHCARHWEHFGQAHFAVGTGSVSKVQAELLADVRQILQRYRRVAFV